jgi:hypothetical protein
MQPTKKNFRRLCEAYGALKKIYDATAQINSGLHKKHEEDNRIISLLTFRIWGAGAPVGNIKIMERLQEEWKAREELNNATTKTKKQTRQSATRPASTQRSKSNP